MSSRSVIFLGILAVSLLIVGCLWFHKPLFMQDITVSQNNLPSVDSNKSEENKSSKFASLKELENNLTSDETEAFEEDNITKEIRKTIFAEVPTTDEKKESEGLEDKNDSFINQEIFEVENEISQTLFDNPIKFQFASASLTPQSRKVLKEVAKKLKQLTNIEIEVAGYTDSKGDESFNKTLSLQRAKSVRRYLIKQGVDKDIITAKGYGESNFIYDPKDKRNRRVEIHIKERK